MSNIEAMPVRADTGKFFLFSSLIYEYRGVGDILCNWGKIF